MDVRSHIAEIEPLVHGCGFSALALCREADIAPSTWSRWKVGQAARGSAWRRIAPALERMGVPGAAEIARRPVHAVADGGSVQAAA